MALFGLGKKLKNVSSASKRVENRELMQACVWAGVWAASSDGSFEPAEADRLQALLSTNPKLSHFGAELTDTINEARTLAQSGGGRALKLRAQREVADVKGVRTDAEDVLVVALSVADEGGIGPEEEATLRNIASVLGLRYEDYV